jgi:hypothetical protein
LSRHRDGEEEPDTGQADHAESGAAAAERTAWTSGLPGAGGESGIPRRIVEEKGVDVPEHERAADESDQGKKASHHRQNPRQSVGAGESSENHTRDERDEAGSRMAERAARVGRSLFLLQALHA